MGAMRQSAVFSCKGLGDGLISLVLSHNLHLNGHAVTTYHPSLTALQPWFRALPIAPFPTDLRRTLEPLDQIFLFLEKTPHMQPILDLCLSTYRHKTTILNPIATLNRDYPHWEEGQFSGSRTFVENLYNFCQNKLLFHVVTRSNGITPPRSLRHRCFPRRVLLHPTSSREGKNWTAAKYLRLAEKLSQEGYEVQWILSNTERPLWNLAEPQAPLFCNLEEIAACIYESGYLIGNDSGMGHLASCLQIPTLTLCRAELSSRFWRPGWAPGTVLYPHRWIPNLKGLRLRDQYWKKWISVHRALSAFHDLTRICN